MILLLIVCVFWCHGAAAGAESYSRYYIADVNGGMLEANRCAVNVSRQIFSWMIHVRDPDHAKYLYAVAMDQLALRLSAGCGVCEAMPYVAQRLLNAHSQAVAQRVALQVPVVQGDGWRETTRLLSESHGDACRGQTYTRSDAAQMLQCLTPVQKTVKRKLVVHHFP